MPAETMKILSYLICVFKGHKAYVYLGDRVNTYNFCRRCGHRVRTFHTPQNWYEVESEENHGVSPLY